MQSLLIRRHLWTDDQMSFLFSFPWCFSSRPLHSGDGFIICANKGGCIHQAHITFSWLVSTVILNRSLLFTLGPNEKYFVHSFPTVTSLWNRFQSSTCPKSDVFLFKNCSFLFPDRNSRPVIKIQNMRDPAVWTGYWWLVLMWQANSHFRKCSVSLFTCCLVSFCCCILQLNRI